METPYWIEIPAHRVLAVSREQFDADYERLSEHGEVLISDARSTHIRRTRDGKLFRWPRFHAGTFDAGNIITLEEM